MTRMLLGWSKPPVRAVLGVSLAALLASTAVAAAQSLKDVPRERTLISQGWDFYNQIPSTDNFNPYAGVLLHQRNNLHYTVYEALFYTNHNTNERIPWLAESMEMNDDFTEVTIHQHCRCFGAPKKAPKSSELTIHRPCRCFRAPKTPPKSSAFL